MTMPLQFSLFETALGWCAIIAGDDGIVGSVLPEDGAEAVRARCRKLYPGALEAPPDGELAEAVRRVRALIDGDDDDLADLALDMSAIEPFEQQVYAIARRIRPGQTSTYGEIARALGDVAQSQAVGRAMGRNPFPPIVPCHRVVGAGQKLGGFSAAGGRPLKLRLLDIERRWAKDDLFGRSGGPSQVSS
jgi:methylated-DNA-[protein]-cysteine S-methyltransferase